MVHEVIATEVQIAVAADGCHAEDVARLRARRRQLLGQIEEAKAAQLAELVPA